MSKKTQNIHDEYLAYHERFEKKYGKGVSIVLMQVGSFHEAYATTNRGPDLFKLSDLLNIVCTRKDKTIENIDEKNPYMLGFPSAALQKFLKILVDNKYIVIVIDQTTLPPNPAREITGIYSDATFLDGNVVDSKFIMLLFIEINSLINNSQNKLDKTKSNISIGMVSIEVSTGYINYYETHGSGIINENEALEECQRYYHYFRPAELIFYLIDNTQNVQNTQNTQNKNSFSSSEEDSDSDNNKILEDLRKKLNKSIQNKIDVIPNQILFTYNKINNAFTKINYQNNILKKVYPNTGFLSPIENLGLEKYPYSTLGITLLFDWIHQHNDNLLKEIQKPVFFDNHKYMILGNNAQYQLNIVDYYNYENNNSKFNSIKYQSLNDVINNCITNMGKRNLKMRLCAPYTDRTIIQNYYDLTEKIINLENIYEIVRNYLKEICDLERLFRKITIKFIQPYELYQIYTSFLSIINMTQALLKTSFKNELLKIFDKKNINLFNECINELNNKWSIEKIKKNNLVEIKENLYNDGIYKNIDDIINKIDHSIGFMEKLAKKLEFFIEQATEKSSKNKTKKNIKDKKKNNDSELEELDEESSKMISIKHNDRDGYYLLTTKTRGLKLKEEIKDLEKISIDPKTEVLVKDLIFKDLNNTMKISYPGLEKYSDEVETLYENLNNLMKEYFCKDVKQWYDKYSDMFKVIIKFIIEIDFICNNVFTSKKFHYTKPIIKQCPDKVIDLDKCDMSSPDSDDLEKELKMFEQNNKDCDSDTNKSTSSGEEKYTFGSFVHAKKLRHPIIEQLIDYEYVPHDVKLDNKDKGNMIYGTNSVGKSSLMKAVGLNIIMAQCGLYVPSEHFEYNIFSSIYTRISGNDNLFRGQSSFIVEMNELRSILKRCNHNSLVIGDEICRGTEHLSGTAIVGATIMRLIDNNAKFLFATHLHDLPSLTQIKKLNNVRFFHLSVEKKGGELIFNRHLKEGTGEQVYGITIANYILDDPKFIKKAVELKNDLMQKNNINYKLVNDKKSLYNNDMFIDKCSVCESEDKLETHHIIYQKDYKETPYGEINNKKFHIVKNHKSNLIVLCQKCHDDLHNNKIQINSLVKTSNGIKVK